MPYSFSPSRPPSCTTKTTRCALTACSRVDGTCQCCWLPSRQPPSLSPTCAFWAQRMISSVASFLLTMLRTRWLPLSTATVKDRVPLHGIAVGSRQEGRSFSVECLRLHCRQVGAGTQAGVQALAVRALAPAAERRRQLRGHCVGPHRGNTAGRQAHMPWWMV